jgi:hypothetical protein
VTARFGSWERHAVEIVMEQRRHPSFYLAEWSSPTWLAKEVVLEHYAQEYGVPVERLEVCEKPKEAQELAQLLRIQGMTPLQWERHLDDVLELP